MRRLKIILNFRNQLFSSFNCVKTAHSSWICLFKANLDLLSQAHSYEFICQCWRTQATYLHQCACVWWCACHALTPFQPSRWSCVATTDFKLVYLSHRFHFASFLLFIVQLFKLFVVIQTARRVPIRPHLSSMFLFDSSQNARSCLAFTSNYSKYLILQSVAKMQTFTKAWHTYSNAAHIHIHICIAQLFFIMPERVPFSYRCVCIEKWHASPIPASFPSQIISIRLLLQFFYAIWTKPFSHFTFHLPLVLCTYT